MDLMELELKNLIIIDTSFSAAEYGIFATNIYIEQDYYNKRRKKNRKWKDAIFIN